MNEEQLRRALDQVLVGRLSRRAFIERMAGLGIAAPLACQMLVSAGIAAAQAPDPFVPAKRGGGGALRVLMWQARTMLHPGLAVGTKDWDASRMFYEPLASFDSARDLVPVLAREIPSVENGGVAKDGMHCRRCQTGNREGRRFCAACERRSRPPASSGSQ